MHQQVRSLAVRQRGLWREALRRQRLGHDIHQLDFPEHAAPLFVRQDVLQAQHIARELLDLGLCPVDLVKLCLQLAERSRGAGRGAVQGICHALLHLFQASLHRFDHLGLRACLRLADRGQPVLHHLQHLRLCPRLMLRHRGQATGQPLLPGAQGSRPGRPWSQSAQRAERCCAQPRPRPAGRGPPGKSAKSKPHTPQHHCQMQGIAEVDHDVADLYHARPNSFSMSLSFSST